MRRRVLALAVVATVLAGMTAVAAPAHADTGSVLLGIQAPMDLFTWSGFVPGTPSYVSGDDQVVEVTSTGVTARRTGLPGAADMGVSAEGLLVALPALGKDRGSGG